MSTYFACAQNLENQLCCFGSQYLWQKCGSPCKRELAYNSSFFIYQREAGRRMDGGLCEWKHGIWNENTESTEEKATPISHQGAVLVMVLVAEVLKENFTYGLRWNLQWYPETQANSDEGFSRINSKLLSLAFILCFQSAFSFPSSIQPLCHPYILYMSFPLIELR